ncbi:MAG TPA: hypothetical protein VFR15_03655 [Chloroflexia bacterium]|nr:hypothetical protein [Chloroflexia bacterium]
MSYYYGLRGWLEMSHADFPQVRDRLVELQGKYTEDEQFSLYMKGWCWINNEISFTHYVFYGADVRLAGLDLLESVLTDLTGLGRRIRGYFHAQGEDLESNFVYKIAHDAWTVEEVSSLVDWEADDDD